MTNRSSPGTLVDQPQISTLLSAERLAPFIRLAGTELDAIRLHNQSLRLSAALMPAIALIEIALRNASSEQLRTKLGVSDWLTSPPAAHLKWDDLEKKSINRAIKHAQRAAYAKLTNADKKALDALAYPRGLPASGVPHEKRAKARQAQIQVGMGQVIAQLTLAFWKRLFSSDYETALWKPILRVLFPNKSITRPQVAQHLEVIYEARNRIAHHEPIIDGRLDKLMESIDFLCQNFASKGPDHEAVLANLIQPFRAEINDEVASTKSLVDSFSVTLSN